MCGIAGFQGDRSGNDLAAMTEAMAHRGPDDSGEWYSTDRSVGLGHRRLSIIDVSALGHQPMVNAEGQTVIVFNGEIYNFRQLRAELERAGHCFRSQSDTEVLLALYEKYGEGMLGRLNGIFALAIYDIRLDSLFLAGDEMAIKPLYYSETGQGFVFASELKAILRRPAHPHELDVATLFRSLGFLWSPGGSTPVKGISRLGPGQALIVKSGRVVKRWTWAEPTWNQPSVELSPAEAIQGVRDGLFTAVQRQLVADVPVGAFLSGGLDSSAVVAMARQAGASMDCFTIDVGAEGDTGVTNDLPYARLAAQHLGTKLHEIKVDSSRMAGDLEQMVWQLDEPLADPAGLYVMYISQLARRHGIKVLLSGAGGDDLFSGYRRHTALIRERYWSRLPTSIRAALRATTGRWSQSGALLRRLTKTFAYADRAPVERLTGYFLWADAERIRALFAPQYQKELSRLRMAQPLEDFLSLLPADLPPLHRMLALEQRFFLSDHNLLYTDKMSMAAGVEVRVPFLDRDLVRFANGLPPSVKYRHGQAKWILKKAMEPFLPASIIHRPKTGFGAPLRTWLRHDLKALVGDTLSPETLRSRGLFDPTAVSKLVQDDREGRVDAAYTILGLVCIEIWCRRYASASQPVC